MIISFLRTIFLYSSLILLIRLMGKRQLGQMEPSEFAVTMLAANLVSIPMQDGGIPLLSGLIPMATVLALELVLSGASLRNLTLRRLLCGNPVVLIAHGQILQKNLRRTCITVDELLGLLREKEVLDPARVQYAILETGGNLSVFPLPQGNAALQVPVFPVPLITDGKVLEANLHKMGKDRAWLLRFLEEKGRKAPSVFLLTLDEQGQIRLYDKEA